MADDLNIIFADAKAKAESASNIAELWANGTDTDTVNTSNGVLPSLRKFMVDNVSQISQSKFDIDLSTADYTLTPTEILENLYFRTTGNTVARILTLPATPKILYIENSGTVTLTIKVGTTSIPLVPSATSIYYVDGTTDGLVNIIEEKLFNNDSASTAPNVSNDNTEGYSVGSRWFDLVGVEAYRCLDASTGAAVWVKTSLTLDELGALAIANTASDVPYSGTLSATDVANALDELDSSKEPADATILKDADIGTTVQGYDADTLFADTSDNLSVGFTTDIEVLTSDTITPDMTKPSVKTRIMAGNLTINMPTGGNGVCHIILTVDGSDRTVTLGTNVNSTGGIPTLTASTVWVATVIRVSATYAVVLFSQVD